MMPVKEWYALAMPLVISLHARCTLSSGCHIDMAQRLGSILLVLYSISLSSLLEIGSTVTVSKL